MGVGDVMVDGRTKDIGPDSTGGSIHISTGL